MEKILDLATELGAELLKLQPNTPQRASALNGLGHVVDNVKGHFALAEAKPAEPDVTMNPPPAAAVKAKTKPAQ